MIRALAFVALLWPACASAQMGMMQTVAPFLPQAAAPSCAVPGDTTWNPSDKNGTVTLSGGNLTATSTNTSNFAGVRSVNSASNCKVYFEITCINLGVASDGLIAGIGSASATLSNYLGSDAFAVGVQQKTSGGGQYWYRNAASGPVITAALCPAPSGTVGFAVDFTQTTWQMWTRTAPSTTWGGSSSGADPATTTNGLIGWTTASGPWFIMFTGLSGAPNGNPALTLCVKSACKVADPPVGFRWWSGL